MIRSWRSPLLAVALAAFAFQVGSAANVRCEMAAAAPVSSRGDHGEHHHSGGSQSAHQSGCVCVAGCSVAFRLPGRATAIPYALVRSWPAPLPGAKPVELLPLVAQPFALPLANAPPVPA